MGGRQEQESGPPYGPLRAARRRRTPDRGVALRALDDRHGAPEASRRRRTSGAACRATRYSAASTFSSHRLRRFSAPWLVNVSPSASVPMRPWDSADAGHVRISGRGGGTESGTAVPYRSRGKIPGRRAPAHDPSRVRKRRSGARPGARSNEIRLHPRKEMTLPKSTSPQRQRQASRPDHGRGPASRNARNPRRLQAPDAAAGGRPADARRSTRRCR